MIKSDKIFPLFNNKFDFTNFVNALSDDVLMIDSKERITFFNTGASKLTGYSARELSKLSLKDLVSKKSYQKIKQLLGKRKVGNKCLGPKERIELLSKGKRIIMVNVLLIGSLGSNQAYNLVLFNSNKEIIALEDLDRVKSEFISVASHQLKTPVAAINWYTESLLNREVGDITDKQKKYLGEISKNGNRIVSLVNDLLNVSRVGFKSIKVNLIKLDLNKLILEIIDELDPLLKSKGGKIVFKNTALKSSQIYLDRNLMGHIIRNILSNSIRYLKTGKSGKVEIKLSKNNDAYLLAFKDNGIGIPTRDQTSIFNKFFRAENALKAVSDGTGLGLYIVKMMSDMLGVKVWFVSKYNIGSTFYLSIPISSSTQKKSV